MFSHLALSASFLKDSPKLARVFIKKGKFGKQPTSDIKTVYMPKYQIYTILQTDIKPT
jgi:hypothetical protein